MGDEDDPLTGLQSRNNLIFVRDPMCDIHGQIARAPEILDILFSDSGGLPLALGAGPSHCWGGWQRWRRLELWALELGDWETEARGRRKEKGEVFTLLYMVKIPNVPLLSHEPRLFPTKSCVRCGWITQTILMRFP
jgi:hypothetical protein